MHAHQQIASVADFAHHQRNVRISVDAVFECVAGPRSDLGRQFEFRDAVQQFLRAPAIRDKVLDGDELEAVAFGEFDEPVEALHGAVFGHDLADDAGRVQPGQTREIDGCFRLPRAHQHAAVARAQRKRVSGAKQIARTSRRIEQCLNRRGAIVRRNSRGRAAARFNRNRECRFVHRAIFGNHLRQMQLVQALADHRNANQAARVLAHEIDRFGRHHLCGHYQVAFVFAILVVQHDDHLAGADVLDRVLDRVERRRLFQGLVRSGSTCVSRCSERYEGSRWPDRR